ncbi:hypothetical protein EW145_g4121 [Phellinidium pouzarii]|uniref:Aminotransferase class I/classII large domain-containing protein n=1 Tax=Phellinidium pouzarii TaxID=167371 RepID=A0A4S4L627_9AGAM|nr:hypothetical protein EW145_g4121 [Phellinidium pouzarii]
MSVTIEHDSAVSTSLTAQRDASQTFPAPAPLPLPRDFYKQFLADGTQMKQNPIRSLEHYERQPGMLTLLAGKPNTSVFPLTSFQFTATSPENPSRQDQLSVTGALLAQSLQYCPTAGIPSLLEWLAGLQAYSHGRKKEGWRVTTGVGSQDLLYKATSAVINPGDYALIESPSYAGYIPVLTRLKCKIISIESDSEGIKPSSLKTVLENWPKSRPLPKLLYTVPYGCNPSGATTPTDRRREILALARKYNFLIFEDDPYYYLYYGKTPRPKSYFTLELEQPEVGRVVRFDSLSKTISGGLRIGFASGPETIIDAVDILSSISTLQASTFTQVIADTLLRHWGYAGFNAHAERAAAFYRRRRDLFECAMQKHLVGLAEWTTPDAGMFFWIKLLLADPTDPSAPAGDSTTVLQTALAHGVVVLPGVAFMPDGQKTPYIRASFSQLDDNMVEESVKRLASAILETRRQFRSVGRAKL